MTCKKIVNLFLFSFVVLQICAAQNSRIVLKTNFEGQVESGSIDDLIAEVNKGKKLRVGWQLDFDKDGQADLEHWVDADFITVLNGHVFNQIRPIYRQVPKMELPQVEILNSDTKWTAVIGTNGKLISRMIIPDLHLIEDENMRQMMEKRTAVKERIVATMWAIIE